MTNKEQVCLATISIPLDAIEDAFTKSKEAIKHGLSKESVSCTFVMDTDGTYRFSSVNKAERRDKLKSCFGGFQESQNCRKCFLATACKLVCAAYVEETGEEPEPKPIKRKAVINYDTISHEDNEELPDSEVERNGVEVDGWRRSKKSDNLYAAFFIGKDLVRFTIFPSRYAPGEFTVCMSTDEEKPHFENGFKSESEAQSHVKNIVSTISPGEV